MSQSWNEASGALAGAGWLSGAQLRGASKSRQGTKDSNLLYISDFKLVLKDGLPGCGAAARMYEAQRTGLLLASRHPLVFA